MSLRLDHVTLKWPEFTLEAAMNLSAPITGLFGPSGSGKTTFLEIIAGLRRPTTGVVTLDERILTDADRHLHVPPEQRRVGYVPQDLALFPHLNVEANLRYGFAPALRGALQPQPVIELLELSTLLARPIHRLSGGEQQRVALGRALLTSPQVLLLDEPLSGLDDRLKERILPYIKAVQSEFQVPIVYVTHSRRELSLICDAVLHIERGRVLKGAEET